MLPNERTTRSEVLALPDEVEALVAAPERGMARPYVEFLRKEGINVQVVADADSAFEEALLHRPHMVLVDDRIPPGGGIELCERLKKNSRTHFIPAILVTQNDIQQHRVRALSVGVDAVFQPDTDESERKARLWALLRTQAIHRRQEKKQRTQGSVMKQRSRWISGFVHDLQSSIGALSANFDYLAHAAQEPSAVQGVELDECVRDTRTVFRQVARGLRTVLDFERFENGRAALKEVPVSMGALAVDVQRELDWQAKATGKEITLKRVAGEQAVVGDPDYLKEVVMNLVTFSLRQPDNQRTAIQIWSPGGVTRLSVGGDREKIPAEDETTIFEPYARVSKQAPVGHGLGLALAKVVVELHGGSIWVEDVEGAGSAFVVELKAETSARRLRPVE